MKISLINLLILQRRRFIYIAKWNTLIKNGFLCPNSSCENSPSLCTLIAQKGFVGNIYRIRTNNTVCHINDPIFHNLTQMQMKFPSKALQKGNPQIRQPFSLTLNEWHPKNRMYSSIEDAQNKVTPSLTYLLYLNFVHNIQRLLKGTEYLVIVVICDCNFLQSFVDKTVCTNIPIQ